MKKPWLEHDEEQVPRTFNIPDQTIIDLFDAAVRFNPRSPSLIFSHADSLRLISTRRKRAKDERIIFSV
jgi:hypothetical protein